MMNADENELDPVADEYAEDELFAVEKPPVRVTVRQYSNQQRQAAQNYLNSQDPTTGRDIMVILGLTFLPFIIVMIIAACAKQ